MPKWSDNYLNILRFRFDLKSKTPLNMLIEPRELIQRYICIEQNRIRLFSDDDAGTKWQVKFKNWLHGAHFRVIRRKHKLSIVGEYGFPRSANSARRWIDEFEHRLGLLFRYDISAWPKAEIERRRVRVKYLSATKTVAEIAEILRSELFTKATARTVRRDLDTLGVRAVGQKYIERPAAPLHFVRVSGVDYVLAAPIVPIESPPSKPRKGGGKRRRKP